MKDKWRDEYVLVARSDNSVAIFNQTSCLLVAPFCWSLYSLVTQRLEVFVQARFLSTTVGKIQYIMTQEDDLNDAKIGNDEFLRQDEKTSKPKSMSKFKFKFLKKSKARFIFESKLEIGKISEIDRITIPIKSI